MTGTPALRLVGLGKSFGRVPVLSDIDLEVGAGELVGLMGPNGAGKSTLIKVLAGVHPASAGYIELHGQRVTSLAGRADVGFVHQDLGLVDELGISDNLRLGQAPLRKWGPLVDGAAERDAAARALASVGLDLPVSTAVGELAPGEKALVGVARALGRGATLLFVDEATSTLPVPEARIVTDALTRITDAGATVVMVSHKLSEILDSTRRVVLLLDGRVAGDRSTSGLGRSELVAMLSRHEQTRTAAATTELDQPPVPVDQAPLLELVGACAGRAGPVDLVVRPGEVLGLTGTPGSGLHDVGFLAHGNLPPRSGVRRTAPGVRTALVPPHRETQGGFPGMAIMPNLTISALGRWRNRLGMLALRRERSDAQRIVDELQVHPGDASADFGSLSGGNKQKVIVGRAAATGAEVLVLCEPTRGVDVAAREEIYALIRSLASPTTGVLIVSSDAEDLLAVCDRVAAVHDGAVSPWQPVHSLTNDDLEAVL